MSRLGTLPWFAAIGICLAVLSLEWLAAAGTPLKTAWLSAPAPSPAVARSHTRDAGDLAMVLGRPLFSQSRRPAPPPAHDAENARSFPRLAGIVIVPGFRVALFENAQKQTQAVAKDGMIEGWRIVHIDPETIRMETGDRLMTLRPSLLPPQIFAASKPDRWGIAPPTGLLRARWANPQLQP